MNNIKVVMLAGGTEVLCELEVYPPTSSWAPTHYTLVKPFKIHWIPVPQQTSQGVQIQMTPALVPLLALGMTPSIKIEASAVIAPPYEASKDFTAKYVQQTTGLVLA